MHSYFTVYTKDKNLRLAITVQPLTFRGPHTSHTMPGSTLPNLLSYTRAYLRSPIIVFKDFVLLCLALQGCIVLLYPDDVCRDRNIALLPRETASLGGPTPLGTCNCGNSVAQAIEMGCKYDALAAAWLPPQCRDEALTREFEMAGVGPGGQWQYWKDENFTQEIPRNELGMHADEPGFLFHAVAEWHFLHCIFYWRKQFRARSTGVFVEPRYNTEGHINHCTSILRDGLEGKVVSGVLLVSDPRPGSALDDAAME